MNKDNENLQKQIDELNARLDLFNNATTIPMEVAAAFRGRLFALGSSAKTAASETQSVNEAGSDSYGVAKPPDRFIDLGDGGNIPVYNN